MSTVTSPAAAAPLRLVAVDLYRDIHKGIRSELFAVTEQAGRLDPASRADRIALASHVGSTVDLLVEHAEHEDGAIQPVLEEVLPALADRVAAEHEAVERRLRGLAALSAETVEAPGSARRGAVHRLYVELAAFTSAYLDHQDVEERLVMPALEDAVGVEAVAGIHAAIVGAIPPDQMARSLAVMLPAMNVDDRTELLGGLRAGAPDEVFAAVWSLAGSVLAATDRDALAGRLGIA
ncbi:MAG TPA: hemerythrin domain-containing protein [Acidimicrobiales bacterium]